MARGGEQVEEQSRAMVDRNEVVLVGRVACDPQEKQLPSGDTVWLFRLVVRRPDGMTSRQKVDSLDCCAWTPRVQRSIRVWREGDQVEVGGAIRRRFFRGSAGAQSRVEVEVASARLRRRAAAG
ncbi:single-stranded DNA-binding protein [uncultured Nocardioides sp.]|uniref:single-stranded DNA-binding protein n=1 Tax=uncultured Nocardioides sp. TaxID=198441 RepID=UPI002607EEED|nr:single-stranded DNA-binding protein [uncultured Nocardioides sp.]|tara:strand:- start:371 stop:742 length:372 start_codon:yes stop_codon:yes gene_type:complete